MRAALGLTAALTASAALSGCMAYQEHPERLARAQQLIPTEQFGVTVTNTPEQIVLGVHPDGLSANQQAALGVFVSRWRANGGGPVTLRAPVGLGPNARAMEDGTAAYLVKLGVPRERLVESSYPARSVAGAAPLLASYERFEASGPNCSGGWDNIMATGANAPADHFGCAVTADVAVQVANPRDFLAPAVETAADNSRRQVVLGKYREGSVTSSAKDDQANGKVSDTVSGSN